jgi:hypothetical protein
LYSTTVAKYGQFGVIGRRHNRSQSLSRSVISPLFRILRLHDEHDETQLFRNNTGGEVYRIAEHVS